jgi:hypothetical protein
MRCGGRDARTPLDKARKPNLTDVGDDDRESLTASCDVFTESLDVIHNNA